MEKVSAQPLQVGGPVSPSALYVPRAVEADLLAALLAGTSCLVLAPPGAGKSSLALRLQERLVAGGAASAYVSLTEVAGDGPEDWFLCLARLVAGRLDLPDPASFWRREQESPPAQRWQRFLRVEVLGRQFSKVVLILNDLDAALALPFARAELPASLRSVREARGTDSAWERLTLCVLGAVDAPAVGLAALGRTFVLPDFSPEEAAALAPALGSDGERWLDAILDWTHGHPGLTLRLCQALREQEERPVRPSPSEASAHIEELARRVLGRPGAFSDSLLASIERRFRKDEPGAGALLGLYRRLLRRGSLPSDPDDPVQRALVAAGLAAERQEGGAAVLAPRCRLLAAIFDDAWAARREGERLLAPRAAEWMKDPERLLRGDELAEALRWVEGREDVSAAERALLIASLEQARRDDDRRREEQQVQEDLRRARERAVQRRLQLAVLGALLGVIVVLLGGVGYLAWGRGVARRERDAAERERVATAMHLRGATDDLERERAAHARTRQALAQRQQELTQARTTMDQVRRELGSMEARLKEVGGRVEAIFKKRIPVKGARLGADTGINNKVVDNVLLNRAWPALRSCYPVAGPLPAQLRVVLTVQPDGKVSEVGHEVRSAETGACVEAALKGVRFPGFAGAHFVRVTYVFVGPRRQEPARRRRPSRGPLPTRRRPAAGGGGLPAAPGRAQRRERRSSEIGTWRSAGAPFLLLRARAPMRTPQRTMRIFTAIQITPR